MLDFANTLHAALTRMNREWRERSDTDDFDGACCTGHIEQRTKALSWNSNGSLRYAEANRIGVQQMIDHPHDGLPTDVDPGGAELVEPSS